MATTAQASASKYDSMPGVHITVGRQKFHQTIDISESTGVFITQDSAERTKAYFATLSSKIDLNSIKIKLNTAEIAEELKAGDFLKKEVSEMSENTLYSKALSTYAILQAIWLSQLPTTYSEKADLVENFSSVFTAGTEVSSRRTIEAMEMEVTKQHRMSLGKYYEASKSSMAKYRFDSGEKAVLVDASKFKEGENPSHLLENGEKWGRIEVKIYGSGSMGPSAAEERASGIEPAPEVNPRQAFSMPPPSLPNLIYQKQGTASAPGANRTKKPAAPQPATKKSGTSTSVINDELIRVKEGQVKLAELDNILKDQRHKQDAVVAAALEVMKIVDSFGSPEDEKNADAQIREAHEEYTSVQALRVFNKLTLEDADAIFQAVNSAQGKELLFEGNNPYVQTLYTVLHNKSEEKHQQPAAEEQETGQLNFTTKEEATEAITTALASDDTELARKITEDMAEKFPKREETIAAVEEISAPAGAEATFKVRTLKRPDELDTYTASAYGTKMFRTTIKMTPEQKDALETAIGTKNILGMSHNKAGEVFRLDLKTDAEELDLSKVFVEFPKLETIGIYNSRNLKGIPKLSDVTVPTSLKALLIDSERDPYVLYRKGQKHIETVSVTGTDIRRLAKEAPHLEVLAIMNNGMKSFCSDNPKALESLNLKTLMLRGNSLSSIPEEISALKSLEVLDLRDNSLTSIPSPLITGQNSKLARLYLGGNKGLKLEKNDLRSLSLQKPLTYISLKGIETEAGFARTYLHGSKDLENRLNAMSRPKIGELFKAVSAVDLKRVTQMIDHENFDVNSKNADGRTLLMQAMDTLNPKAKNLGDWAAMVDFFLKTGIKDYTDADGLNTAMHIAKMPPQLISDPRVKGILDKIIKQFDGLNDKQKGTNKRAIYFAMEANNVTAANYLLDSGARFGRTQFAFKDKGGVRPFMLACGMDPKAVQTKEALATEGEARKKIASLVERMIKIIEEDPFTINKSPIRAELNAESDVHATAMSKALKAGNVEVVRFLHDKGANFKAKTDDGLTEAMLFAQSSAKLSKEDTYDIMRRIASSRGGRKSLNARTKDDKVDLLMFVSLNNKSDMAEWLLSQPKIYKHSVNEKNKKGETALMGAASTGAKEAMKKLLDYGADPYIKTSKKGSTVFDIVPDKTKKFINDYVSHSGVSATQQEEKATAVSEATETGVKTEAKPEAEIREVNKEETSLKTGTAPQASTRELQVQKEIADMLESIRSTVPSGTAQAKNIEETLNKLTVYRNADEATMTESAKEAFSKAIIESVVDALDAVKEYGSKSADADKAAHEAVTNKLIAHIDKLVITPEEAKAVLNEISGAEEGTYLDDATQALNKIVASETSTTPERQGTASRTEPLIAKITNETRPDSEREIYIAKYMTNFVEKDPSFSMPAKDKEAITSTLMSINNVDRVQAGQILNALVSSAEASRPSSATKTKASQPQSAQETAPKSSEITVLLPVSGNAENYKGNLIDSRTGAQIEVTPESRANLALAFERYTGTLIHLNGELKDRPETIRENIDYVVEHIESALNAEGLKPESVRFKGLEANAKGEVIKQPKQMYQDVKEMLDRLANMAFSDLHPEFNGKRLDGKLLDAEPTEYEDFGEPVEMSKETRKALEDAITSFLGSGSLDSLHEIRQSNKELGDLFSIHKDKMYFVANEQGGEPIVINLHTPEMPKLANINVKAEEKSPVIPQASKGEEGTQTGKTTLDSALLAELRDLAKDSFKKGGSEQGPPVGPAPTLAKSLERIAKFMPEEKTELSEVEERFIGPLGKMERSIDSAINRMRLSTLIKGFSGSPSKENELGKLAEIIATTNFDYNTQQSIKEFVSNLDTNEKTALVRKLQEINRAAPIEISKQTLILELLEVIKPLAGTGTGASQAKTGEEQNPTQIREMQKVEHATTTSLRKELESLEKLVEQEIQLIIPIKNQVTRLNSIGTDELSSAIKDPTAVTLLMEANHTIADIRTAGLKYVKNLEESAKNRTPRPENERKALVKMIKASLTEISAELLDTDLQHIETHTNNTASVTTSSRETIAHPVQETRRVGEGAEPQSAKQAPATQELQVTALADFFSVVSYGDAKAIVTALKTHPEFADTMTPSSGFLPLTWLSANAPSIKGHDADDAVLAITESKDSALARKELVNGIDRRGMTPIAQAVEAGAPTDYIKLLYDLGADPEKHGPGKQSAADIAKSKGNKEVLALFNLGLDTSAPATKSVPPLQPAAVEKERSAFYPFEEMQSNTGFKLYALHPSNATREQSMKLLEEHGLRPLTLKEACDMVCDQPLVDKLTEGALVNTTLWLAEDNAGKAIDDMRRSKAEGYAYKELKDPEDKMGEITIGTAESSIKIEVNLGKKGGFLQKASGEQNPLRLFMIPQKGYDRSTRFSLHASSADESNLIIGIAANSKTAQPQTGAQQNEKAADAQKQETVASMTPSDVKPVVRHGEDSTKDVRPQAGSKIADEPLENADKLAAELDAVLDVPIDVKIGKETRFRQRRAPKPETKTTLKAELEQLREMAKLNYNNASDPNEMTLLPDKIMGYLHSQIIPAFHGLGQAKEKLEVGYKAIMPAATDYAHALAAMVSKANSGTKLSNVDKSDLYQKRASLVAAIDQVLKNKDIREELAKEVDNPAYIAYEKEQQKEPEIGM